VREAILAAALVELAEQGFEDAGVSGVADRAGVHETSVYRRFGSRENLFVEALLASSESRVPVPDTGSLRGDLVATLRMVCAGVDAPLGLALLRTGALAGGDKYQDERRQFWNTRITAFAPIFERAITRGEITPTIDIPMFLELLVAPVHSRLLVTGFELDDELPERIVDLLIAGLRVAETSLARNPTSTGPGRRG
jgi:AcrR family transcriptional regulator